MYVIKSPRHMPLATDNYFLEDDDNMVVHAKPTEKEIIKAPTDNAGRE